MRVDDEQDEAAGDQRHADDPGIEQHVLDEAVQGRADHGRRQEGDEHADDEAARVGIVGQRLGDRPQAVEIDRQDGEDRAELDQDLEGLAGRLRSRGNGRPGGGGRSRRPAGTRSGPRRGRERAPRAVATSLRILGRALAEPARLAGALSTRCLRRSDAPRARLRHGTCDSPKVLTEPLTKYGLILAACFASESLMAILHSYPFCPQSRFARLVLAELGHRAGSASRRSRGSAGGRFSRSIPAANSRSSSTRTALRCRVRMVIAEYLDETRGAGLGGSPPAAAGRWRSGSRSAACSTGSWSSSTRR